MSATACIIVNSFIPYYERTDNWTASAWWIHDNIPNYSSMEFYSTFATFNISWHENPKKTIYSYFEPRGCLTNQKMPNFSSSHKTEYEDFLSEISTHSSL